MQKTQSNLCLNRLNGNSGTVLARAICGGSAILLSAKRRTGNDVCAVHSSKNAADGISRDLKGRLPGQLNREQ